MRKLTFIFIIVFASIINVAAQVQAAKQAFDKGTQAAQLKDYERAIEQYRKAIVFSQDETANDEFLARIHFNKGVCLYHLKRFDEAVSEFTKSIKLSKENYQKAFYALGMAHNELKDWKAAIAAFREALNLKKDDGEAWFDLALALLETKDFEAAEKAFENAIKYKSVAYADAHNNIGVILALKGDIDSAENKFKTALQESNGKSVEAQNNLKFCESYKQSFNQTLLAQLNFVRYRE